MLPQHSPYRAPSAISTSLARLMLSNGLATPGRLKDIGGYVRASSDRPVARDALANGPAKLWGLDLIAEVLGVSVCTTRRWAAEEAVPIFCAGVSYFTFRSVLLAWLRSK